MGSDSDAVQFELVNSISELEFSRTKSPVKRMAPRCRSTLLATRARPLFDQFNDFLYFRKTEYLVIDDGATHDEVFALVTDGDGSTNGPTKSMLPMGQRNYRGSWRY